MRNRIAFALVAVLVLASCGQGAAVTATRPPARPAGISDLEWAGLQSLAEIDDHPLYVMHLSTGGSDPVRAGLGSPDGRDAGNPGWGCSLFAALGDPSSRVFGRNFDWQYSPALLLFLDPGDGYSSVSMVDIEYLGFPGERARDLTEAAPADLLGLLDAPAIPFDGMNEAGLVVGMAAVPPGSVPLDPHKDTVDSLGIIRLMLNRAATVAEAVNIVESYNVDFTGQEALHYLVADATGDAALIEYVRGDIRVVRSERAWHHATNFLVSAAESAGGRCGRYDRIAGELDARAGTLDPQGALDLLERVTQPHTQWSIVYDLTTGEIRVALDRDFERIHTFQLG